MGVLANVNAPELELILKSPASVPLLLYVAEEPESTSLEATVVTVDVLFSA